MSVAAVDKEMRVEDLPGLTHAESIDLGRRQLDALIDELKALTESDWDKPTDCERWTVRDIVAHVLGWAQASPSPREMVRLRKASRAVRKELPGSLDSQNEAMVLARRHMSPQRLIEELERAAEPFLTFRRRVGSAVGLLPLRVDTVGWTNARFLLGPIFTRDHFMHRIDISQATGRAMGLGAAERRVVQDIARHWGRSSQADALLRLSGPVGGNYVSGSGGRAIISGDGIDFCRILAGRAEPGVMEIEGDRPAAQTWLQAKVPF
ncbi:MAG: maleylpyruvate isomerase family mycothiol-dependent enzyme [Actinomycetota bacterium]|nr:maleylpyruvate isomerase family mycothiol-dependent enzyme [Actinomycetota bacterium]